MRNATAAAIPLAIALVGGTALPNKSDDTGQRVRIAATVAAEPISSRTLTEQQHAWLEEHNPFGPPASQFPGHRTLIVRQGYTLAHNNVDLIADWVSYRLTRSFVQGMEKRPGTHAFKPDPALPAGRRATPADYKGWNGVYDRGHQVANADSRGRGVQVARESFLLSNMTPQAARLNRNRWRLLEARIQQLAVERNELWVITGPAFVDDDNDGLVAYSVIGTNQVAVPTHYFKIVMARAMDGSGRLESMAFLIPNQQIEGEFDDYLVSIDELEAITGIDFIPRLENLQESELEGSIASAVWARVTSSRQSS